MRTRRLPLPAGLTACLVLSFSSPAFAQDALELLHKMQQALGGADRIAAVRDFEEDAYGDVWTEAGRPIGEVRKRTRWIAPNLLRLDQQGPGNTYVLYFDGTSGWEILPERGTTRTTGAAIDLVGEELEFARGYLSGFMAETWRGIWLADRMPGYTLASPAPNVIRVTRESRATDIVLDPATWLPLKHVSVLPVDPARPIPNETHFIEWTETAGIRFPSKRTDYRNGAKLREAKQITSRVNIGLRPQDLSAKPADSGPVWPSR